MRKLLKEVGDYLTAFVNQRDELALRLRTPASTSIPMLKILEGIEEASTTDLFWSFTTRFENPRSYAQAIVDDFGTKHQAIRLSMIKAGMDPWPPVTVDILSGHESPVSRLRGLASFSRDLIPVPNGGNSVWIFFPLEVSDDRAFASLMKEVVEHEFPFPWCHHLRFIVREDPTIPEPEAALAGVQRVGWYEPDLSIDAITKSFEAEMNDESLPLAERIAPLPILAGSDFAAERYPQALEKYGLLLRYYAPLNNLPMAALALNGMGEVYEKTGDLERANQSYEAALVPASCGHQPAIPVLLNVVTNLGNLKIRQGQWSEAEAYFDSAQQVATVARNAPSRMSALESLGLCQAQQDRPDDAIASWNQGAVIAAQLEDVHWSRILLGRLHEHYRKLGQTAKADELSEQLSALGYPEGAQ